MKTNEEVLRALLRNLNTIETAIFRERIAKICEITLSQIDTWKPGMAFFVDNQTYKLIILKIQRLLEFENEGKKSK